MVLFLEITAFILTGLCVVHSIIYRGREFTVLFFLGGLLLGIMRENIVAGFSDLYAYNPRLFYESFASTYELVLWKFRPAVMLWGTVPLLTLFGYAALALLFLIALRLVIGTGVSLLGKAALIFLSIVVIIPLHLSFLAAVRQIIKLAVT